MDKLDAENRLLLTPNKNNDISGLRTTCFDDRVILDFALKKDGVVLTCDNYTDLIDEQNGNLKLHHK